MVELAWKTHVEAFPSYLFLEICFLLQGLPLALPLATKGPWVLHALLLRKGKIKKTTKKNQPMR